MHTKKSAFSEFSIFRDTVRNSYFKGRSHVISQSYFFLNQKKIFAKMIITFFKLNIFCSNFEDRPGWIWNARIRGLFVKIQIWGYLPPFRSTLKKIILQNPGIFWKIMDFGLQTDDNSSLSSPQMWCLRVLFHRNELVFTEIPFAPLSMIARLDTRWKSDFCVNLSQ